MDKENILDFQEKAKNASPIGGIISVIDDNSICIDGTGSENKILLEDIESDCYYHERIFNGRSKKWKS